MVQKRVFALLVLIFVSVCLNSCQADKIEHDPNTLYVDIGNEVGTIDPQKVETAPDFRVVNDLYAGLVDWDQSNRPIPGLASSWTVSNDGKTYIFHLRPNLKFSDGSEITASDFVYSWQRLVEPKTSAPYNFLLLAVVNAREIIAGKIAPTALGVSAPNARTFVVKLTHPSNEFITYLTSPAVDVVKKDNLEKYGDSWTEPGRIVTSGAYLLKDHVVNGYLLASKNPNFYEESQVKIATIKYLPITNTNVSLDTYMARGLDTTWQNVPVDKFAKIKREFKEQLHVTPWEKVMFYSFNLHLPKYANNVKLRQALSMAIDRQALVEKVLNSGQKPLYSIVTPTIEHGKYRALQYDWANLSNTKRIAMAKRLYLEAGYTNEKPLNVELKYINNDMDKKIALAIASMWQDVLQVNVTLVNQEYKSIEQSWYKGDFDIIEGNWGADYNSVTTYTPLYRCNNGNNHSFYCNAKYDALLDQANAEANEGVQQSLYSQAIVIANNDYPTIALFEPTHQRLVKPRVQNYQISKNYLDNVQSKWFMLKKR